MIHPYTKSDLMRGEQIVRELHGLRGYDAWAERVAKAIAAERERCALVADERRELWRNEYPDHRPDGLEAAEDIAMAIRGALAPQGSAEDGK